jgi:hypothetical protein
MKINQISTLALVLTLMSLSACGAFFEPTQNSDYTIRVVRQGNKYVAIPPTCPAWSGVEANPTDHQPFTQYGCSNARNLAMMVEYPSDLVRGRDIGPQRGVIAVGAVRRYDDNVSRGILWSDQGGVFTPAASSASSTSSALKGNDIGNGSSGSSSAAVATSVGAGP